MTLPHVVAGEVARAAEQNRLITTVNEHSGSIADAAAQFGDHERRISALEATTPAAHWGQWTDNNGGAGTVITNTGAGSPGYIGVKVGDIGVPVGAPTGCTMNAGTFTPEHAGRWLFNIAAQYQGGSTSVRALYLAASTAEHSPTGVRYALLAGPTMSAQSTSAVINLAAGQSVSVYVACWSDNGSVTIHKGQGNLLTAVWLGPA